MCRYRYYYYSTCRHQKTTLFEYCDRAERSTSTSAKSLPADVLLGMEGSTQQPGDCAGQPRIDAPPQASSGLHSSTNIAYTGSASITQEPLLKTSSSLPNQLHRNHSSQAPHKMAEPPLAWQQWVVGGGKKSSAPDAASLRVRDFVPNPVVQQL